MRSFFIFLSFLNITSFTTSAAESSATQPASPTLAIRVAVPDHDAAMQTAHVDLHIVIENISNAPQRIIDEWNSWGYFNLMLEFTVQNGGHKVMKKNENVNWRRNFLTWTTLQPGQVFVRDVVFDPSIWDGIPTTADGTPVSIKAIFSQIENKEGSWTVFDGKEIKEKHVDSIWSGKIESPVISISNPARR